MMRKVAYRMAVERDVSIIHQLMEAVYQKMEDKTLYVCDDREFVEKHISKDGFCIVANDETGDIVGSLLVRFPGQDTDNLGLDINLPSGELAKVAHMESVVVHPNFRGMGVQSMLLQQAEERLRKRQYHYLLATVAPKNIASIRSFEKNGYDCIKTIEKYGGFLRRIYLKKIL